MIAGGKLNKTCCRWKVNKSRPRLLESPSAPRIKAARKQSSRKGVGFENVHVLHVRALAFVFYSWETLSLETVVASYCDSPVYRTPPVGEHVLE